MHNQIDPWIPVALGKLAMIVICYMIFTFAISKKDYSKCEYEECEDGDMDAFIACDATDDPAAFAWFQNRKK